MEDITAYTENQRLIRSYFKILYSEPGVVAHTKTSTQEEAGGFLRLRPAWSTKWVPGQPGLYRETLSWKKKKKKYKQTKKKQKQKQKKLYSTNLENFKTLEMDNILDRCNLPESNKNQINYLNSLVTPKEV
jgi:hypothetical protein